MISSPVKPMTLSRILLIQACTFLQSGTDTFKCIVNLYTTSSFCICQPCCHSLFKFRPGHHLPPLPAGCHTSSPTLHTGSHISSPILHTESRISSPLLHTGSHISSSFMSVWIASSSSAYCASTSSRYSAAPSAKNDSVLSGVTMPSFHISMIVI